MNYKVIVQYDGTRYEGWQKQKSTGNTIQGKLEEILSRMLETKVEVHGAGRTDSGVHAAGQTANFQLPDSWVREHGKGDVEKIWEYLNQYLPEDIAIVSLKRASDRFHSRLNAKEKVYRYRISTSTVSNVFERKYIYPLNERLDVDKMKKAADLLTGTKDFKSFCGNKNLKKSTVRYIASITFKEGDGELSITFTGNGFLHNMVRILTGTLIEVGQGKREPESMSEILESQDRTRAGVTAPARGLTLMKVIY